MRAGTFHEQVLSQTVLPILVVLSLGISHCNSSSPCSIRAADYDQSCSQDSDCVAVFNGDYCTECPCENTAINIDAQPQYNSDFLKGKYLACPCPAPPAVACNQGTCGLRSTEQPDASGAD